MFAQCKKIALLTTLCAAATMPIAAHAGNVCMSCGPSGGSEALSLGVGIVVIGSMSMLEGSGKIIVDTVSTAADGVTVVLKGSTQAVSTTIKLSSKAIEKTALVSGTAVEVSATTTGYLLVSAGKVLAFIPNEVGNALMHHNKI